jgi:hypothetical protein
MTVKELRPGDPGYEEARAKAIENVTADPRKIPVAQWSRDHWSLLAYIECRCVDNNGTVDKKHMRCNEFRHPMHAVNRRYGDLSAWSAANGTRAKLAKPIKIDGKAVDVVRVAAHDDWDVLNELEDAGLVDVVSEANGFVKLTAAGKAMAAKIRLHKTNGGEFSNFDPDR